MGMEDAVTKHNVTASGNGKHKARNTLATNYLMKHRLNRKKTVNT